MQYHASKPALKIRDDHESLSDEPFATKSRAYQYRTNMYFLLDCMISASMFFILIPLLPWMCFCLFADAIFKIRLPFALDDYCLEKYYRRRDGVARTRIDVLDLTERPGD